MKPTYISTLLYLFVVLLTFSASGQVIPAENDTLNYRLVGFSVPETPKAVSYKLEVAPGRINNHYDFQKNIIYTTTEGDNRIIATIPEFGRDYTWCMTALKKNGRVIGKGRLFHFTTGRTSHVDTAKYRMRILANKLKTRDLLVFVDYLGTLCNLQGEPVWFLPPNIDSNEHQTVRDFKLTPQGTITFLRTYAGNVDAYEIDYNGNILWKAPNNGRVNNDTSEFYHHEFTRLANGHYMIAGSENRMQVIKDTAAQALSVKREQKTIVENNGILYKAASFGTLIEYDTTGKIIWSWKISEHIPGIAEILEDKNSPYRSTHLNSFEVDEKNNVIYLSLRNINSIWKISYPDGKIIAKYDGGDLPDEMLFKAQHTVRKTKNGDLYMFNNNSATRQSAFTGKSYLTVIREPASGSVPVPVWSFACDIDSFARHQTITGGSVTELSDGAFLASMGLVNRHFIVNKEKEILWNAITEMANGNGTWVPFGAYRNFPVEGKNRIQSMVFSGK